MRLGWVLLAVALALAPATGVAAAETTDEDPNPHVVVGVPDSGINPYHQFFYRPEDPRLDDHPCTYVPGIDCESVERLDLSLQYAQDHGYEAAYEKDKDLWESLDPDTWYWIPETPFVAVMCEPRTSSGSAVSSTSDTCILDRGSSHGTGTTASVLAENPEALIAFKQGRSSVQAFLDDSIPVDVFSVSWGYVAPLPIPQDVPGLYVKAAGNDPRSTLADGWSGHPGAISVGGAYRTQYDLYGVGSASTGSEEGMASKQPDVVGPFCRDVPQPEARSGYRQACGTSFSAPTVAGALSKVILEVRRSSGYTGSVDGETVDPIHGLERHDLRTAMNRSATYDPDGGGPDSIPPSHPTGVPLNPAAPWLQWGWGWYDGDVAEATAQALVDGEQIDRKPPAARLYMHTLYEARHVYGGPAPMDGQTAADRADKLRESSLELSQAPEVGVDLGRVLEAELPEG